MPVFWLRHDPTRATTTLTIRMTEHDTDPISSQIQTLRVAPVDVDAVVTTWYETHGRALYRYVRPRCRSASDAEEVTQDVFMVLYHRLLRGDTIRQPNAWLFKVGGRLAQKSVARRAWAVTKRDDFARVVEQTSDGTSAEDAVLDQERWQLVRKAARHLPLVERRCITARADGLWPSEICRRFGWSRLRVQNALARGIVKLQQLVQREAQKRGTPRG